MFECDASASAGGGAIMWKSDGFQTTPATHPH